MVVGKKSGNEIDPISELEILVIIGTQEILPN